MVYVRHWGWLVVDRVVVRGHPNRRLEIQPSGPATLGLGPHPYICHRTLYFSAFPTNTSR